MRCVKEATRGLCGYIKLKGFGHGTRAMPMVDVAHHLVHGLARTKGEENLQRKKGTEGGSLAALNASQHIAVGR